MKSIHCRKPVRPLQQPPLPPETVVCPPPDGCIHVAYSFLMKMVVDGSNGPHFSFVFASFARRSTKILDSGQLERHRLNAVFASMSFPVLTRTIPSSQRSSTRLGCDAIEASKLRSDSW